MTRPDSPIEDFLDRLYLQLPQNPRAARRILAEADAHLRDVADAIGGDRVEAERQAVQRFGEAGTVALAQRDVRGTVLAATRAAIAVCAVALIAAGVTGLATGALHRSGGRVAASAQLATVLREIATATSFEVACSNPGSRTSANCGRTFVIRTPAYVMSAVLPCPDDPATPPIQCLSAGVVSGVETGGDATAGLVAAGLVGLVLLAGTALWRRRRGRPDLPPLWIHAVAAAAFGAGALVLLAQFADRQWVAHQGGFGHLIGGLVAAIVALGYLVAAVRDVRVPGRAQPGK
jgi:LPXTG-motif cell wall-anchored protein